MTTDDPRHPFENYLRIIRDNLAQLRGPVTVTFDRHESGALVYELEAHSEDFIAFFRN
jgi:hypothetical protein